MAFAQALSTRRKVGRAQGGNLVVPLRGGSAALVGRSGSRRLITTVTASDVENPGRGIVAWLEKTQARRSALIVVPDRPSGVAIALRWGISPERFRLAESFDPGSPDAGLRAASGRRPWHSRG